MDVKFAKVYFYKLDVHLRLHLFNRLLMVKDKGLWEKF